MAVAHTLQAHTLGVVVHTLGVVVHTLAAVVRIPGAHTPMEAVLARNPAGAAGTLGGKVYTPAAGAHHTERWVGANATRTSPLVATCTVRYFLPPAQVCCMVWLMTREVI